MAKKNLKILCPRCKEKVFEISLCCFCQHGGQSCPDCRKKESVGERRIRQWLELHNIEFEQEKYFKDCVDKKQLPFDFYIPSLNLCVEYDGEQHFVEKHFFSNDRLIADQFDSLTSYVKYHDSIKTDYCKNNNISLLRIPYTKITNIEKILNENILV